MLKILCSTLCRTSKKAFSQDKSWSLPVLQLIRCRNDLAVVPHNAHPEHLRIENEQEMHALEPTSEDLSHIATNLQDTFNIAAYVNSSNTLKKLVQLGVKLNKIERSRKVTEYLLQLDFEKDMKQHMLFLKDYIQDEEWGAFLTKSIYIFKVSLDDLEVRINYLQWKNFSKCDIQRIVTANPYWLLFSTRRIDTRLGYFQQKFKLSGAQVRALALKKPTIITNTLNQIDVNTFVVKEEMGFNDEEIRRMLLDNPKIWMIHQLNLKRRFEYVHNVMKIDHKDILHCPEILLCRKFRIEQRHKFLKQLGRAQYDPTKENYVSLKALIMGTDVEFCRDVAKCTVDDFNTFLKTL